jgi:hypothetical protein
MRFVVGSILALALSLPALAQWPPRELKPGEKLDEERGVVIRPQADVRADSKASQDKAVTCSLSFFPNPVGNSQVSSISVNYGGIGCVSGNVVETITWNWTSTVPAIYGEFSLQKKSLVITGGCLGGSGHAIAAPTGTGINGPTTAVLEVRDWPGNNLICSDTTILTVF